MAKNIYNKFIITIFIITLIIKSKILEKNIRICLCTTGKRENLYVREYIEHYKKYGVDKIFIYDNNDLNGERFEFIIKDYINIGFVEVINYRGILSPQKNAYNDCLNNNYKNYNWLIFYDMDEFIYLKNLKNLKIFLNNKKFNNCQSIQLNWIFHTDNNLIYYDNRTLKKRFPEKEDISIKNNKKIQGIKSILKGNIKINITDVHILSENLTCCNGFGQNIKEKKIFTYYPDFRYYYIDHYYSKSTEEFLSKLKRGSAVHGYNILHLIMRIRVYFNMNKITKEKIDYIEKEIKLNLSEYRNRTKISKVNNKN